MTTSIKNKMRKVMQLAHRAYQLKSSSMSWVECLKQAWQVVSDEDQGGRVLLYEDEW